MKKQSSAAGTPGKRRINKEAAKYLTALLLFGSNGIVASQIALSSYHIVFLRTMLGSILLLSLFLLTGKRFTAHKYPRDLVFIGISGIAMGASWIFLYAAYQEIGVSIASLLYYCGPVIVMMLSPLLFQEALTGRKTAGFLVVLLGVFLINEQTAGGLNPTGFFYGLASAALYSLMVIANKKAKKVTGMENSCIQLSVSFLTVALFVLWKTGFSFEISSGDWIWIVILGFVNTGLGCYLYFSSISFLDVQMVAVCGYLEPVSAVLLSVLLLSEPMSLWQLLGAAFIIGGAALALTKASSRES